MQNCVGKKITGDSGKNIKQAVGMNTLAPAKHNLPMPTYAFHFCIYTSYLDQIFFFLQWRGNQFPDYKNRDLVLGDSYAFIHWQIDGESDFFPNRKFV